MSRVLNTPATLKELRARCELNSLTFKLDEACQVAYATHDPRTGRSAIVVPKPQATWPESDWIKWDFNVEHELGHLMPDVRDAYQVLQDYNLDVSSFVGSCLNILEDHRQERHKFTEYAGRAKRLESGRREYMKAGGWEIGKSEDIHRQAMETLFVWDWMIREPWMRSLAGAGEQLSTMLSEQQLEWLEKLQLGDYEDTFRSKTTPTAEDELAVLMRIIEEVFNFDPEEEMENAQASDSESGDGDSEGDGEQGQGGESPGQNEDGAGEGEESDGQGDEGDSQSGSGESGDGDGTDKQKGKAQGQGDVGEGDEQGKAQAFTTVSYDDLMAHRHQQNGEQNELSYTGMHIEYGEPQWGDMDLAEAHQYAVIDYTKDEKPERPDQWHHERITDSDHGKGLAKKVRRLLQVRSASRYQHGLKRGKISSRSIFKAGMGDASRDDIFKKKIDNDVLNTAVMIACDMSGSMEGAKSVNAGVSAILLNEAISKIGVPLEMFGFDEGQYPRHTVWKTFNKSVSSSDLAARFSDAIRRQSGSNSDGESILWGYQRLTQRKEKRKILIVLSDGSPASMRGDCDTYTAQVVKEIEGQGLCEVYAIGIRDRNVERYYTKNETIDDPSELEGALLKIIERAILN